MMNSKRTELKRGFTLVETLVAITILVIAVVGPLYAVHRSLVASYTARDSLTAVALAQEGLEFIRSKRDSTYLDPNQSNWLNGLSQCQAAAGCMIDPSASGASQMQPFATSSAALRLNASSYRYNLSSGTVTRFTRKITITTVSSTEVEVKSTVSWMTLKVPYSVTVSEHLYNWQ
jgi:prepilin-type N-terminal cleavage/methylation domain-containing protein